MGDGTADARDDLTGAPGTQVPDNRLDLTSMARGPVSEAVLAAVSFVLLGASIMLFGTVRGFAKRRSAPVAVTKADRDAVRRLVREASESGLEGWAWSQPETFHGLRGMDPETVAFWTGSDAADVARWQGEEVEAEEEEVVAVARQPVRAPQPVRP